MRNHQTQANQCQAMARVESSSRTTSIDGESTRVTSWKPAEWPTDFDVRTALTARTSCITRARCGEVEGQRRWWKVGEMGWEMGGRWEIASHLHHAREVAHAARAARMQHGIEREADEQVEREAVPKVVADDEARRDHELRLEIVVPAIEGDRRRSKAIEGDRRLVEEGRGGGRGRGGGEQKAAEGRRRRPKAAHGS